MQDLSWLVRRPIAHRGLHDGGKEIFENTLSAARAAVEADYSIEMDLQLSADGVPVVFHDETLERLTAEKGNVRARTAEELGKLRIGGTSERIPLLTDLFETVAGKVGLVLELKGIEGADQGFVEAVLKAADGYNEPFAIMSFSHSLLADARLIGTRVPIGLTAEGDESFHETHMEAVEAFHPDFLSYRVSDLPNRFVGEFQGSGRPVITWTVHDAVEQEYSNRFADQITFEGFRP